jgi:hypothetical protein
VGDHLLPSVQYIGPAKPLLNRPESRPTTRTRSISHSSPAMQSEDIAHARAHHSDDTAIPPSSPLSTGFHRHHPHPTPTAEAADPLSGLRRRGVPGPSRDDPAHVSGQGVGAGVGAVRIDVRNPWSDGEGRRKEGWVVQRDKTVGELKEELAGGEYEGQWEREGMRIVWQGRIVRDEEALGDIVGNVSLIPMRWMRFQVAALLIRDRLGNLSTSPSSIL